MNEIYRQGDMIIFKLNDNEVSEAEVKKTAKKIVVGLGESTGHSHDIIPVDDSVLTIHVNDDVVTDDDVAEMDKLMFEIKGMGVILHEEHGPTVFESGKYMRVNQITYNPFTKQLEKVQD